MTAMRIEWKTLPTILFVLVLLMLCFYPKWADVYALFVLRDIFIFGLFALAVDLLWGKTGLLSFGHATFFGIGAYGISIISTTLDPAYGSIVGLLGGVGAAAAVAAIFGYFVLYGGVRGPVFAIATLALGLIAGHVTVSWAKVTGGDMGLVGVPSLGIELLGTRYALADPLVQYYFSLATVATAFIILWAVCRGHYGRVLNAIQDNELRAKGLGYNTNWHLLVVLVLSASLAALAGSLYSGMQNYAGLDLVGLILSTEVLVWVAVGGRGTLFGPLIGVFVVMQLRSEISSIDHRLWPVVLGVFFIGAVFLFPRGLLSLLDMGTKLVRKWYIQAQSRRT